MCCMPYVLVVVLFLLVLLYVVLVFPCDIPPEELDSGQWMGHAVLTYDERGRHVRAVRPQGLRWT